MSYRKQYDFLEPRQATQDVRAYVKLVKPRLTELWCAAYRANSSDTEISQIDMGDTAYLYDHSADRVLVAHAFSAGRDSHIRDKSRMAGHPKAEGADYHRGHLIPHSGGGGTDINLFSQLGTVNIGGFRRLERLFVDLPDSFYFVRLIYSAGSSQRPQFVEQGLLANDPGNPRFEYEYFGN